jgi:hypothetical protein
LGSKLFELVENNPEVLVMLAQFSDDGNKLGLSCSFCAKLDPWRFRFILRELKHEVFGEALKIAPHASI